MANDSLLTALESAYSREDGLALLRRNMQLATDELAEQLRLRSRQLKQIHEEVLSGDFAAWAAETRSLATRRLALAARGNQQAAMEFLQTQKDRFDDDFYDLCYRIGSYNLKKAYTLVDAEQPNVNAVEEALAAGAGEVEFLTVIGQLKDRPYYRAKTSLLAGTHLLVRSQWAARQGRTAEADEDAAAAREALKTAASSTVLEAEARALAEMRLAAIAGPSKPEDVGQHQRAALSIALAGKAWNVATTVRRDLAYGAEGRSDWMNAWDLYRANIEQSEREMWSTRAILGAVTVESKTRVDYQGAVRAAMELGKADATFYERALESAEQGKGRAFLQGVAYAAAPRNVPPNLQERRNRILQRMSEISQGGAGRTELDRLSYSLETVEQQVFTHPRVWVVDTQCQPCSYKEMCSLAPEDGVILSYFVFPERLMIFVIGKQGLAAPPEDVPVPEEKLARWKVELQMTMLLRGEYVTIDQLQRMFDMRIEAFNTKMYLRQFHKLLIEPVAKHLAGKRQIVVAPHGVLSGIPFHALTDASGRAVVDDFAVSYTAGLSVLRWCRARARAELATCFAAGVRRVAGGPKSAAEEAAAVARLFGCRANPATCETVLKNAGKCDVIHLCCHSDMKAVFTSFASLQLEDGPLQQKEIASMPCHTTLVTLSACATAESDTLTRPGAELAGLVGAFFRAGCPTVVASLWPVADEVAVPLAEAFYGALKRDAVNKAEALQLGQLAVKGRSEKGYDDPYFWAPMTLWGTA